MGAVRSAGVVCLVVLGGLGCGKEEDDDTCPPPHQAIVGPDVGPELSSVPACKLPDPQE
jgi:hypothetical protein